MPTTTAVMTAVYGKLPASAIVSTIITVLRDTTGIKWGYVPSSGGKGVRYLTSAEFPIKLYIDIIGSKARSRPASAAVVRVYPPSRFPSAAAWEAELRQIFCTTLPRLGAPESVLAVLNASGGADPDTIAESRRLNAAFAAKYGATPPPSDPYAEECESFPLN